MVEAAIPLVIDAALRGALVALLLLTALRLLRDRSTAPSARIGSLLLLGLVVQTLASLPLLETGPPTAWMAPLIGLSVGNSVLFWIFTRSLFDDEFALRPAHLVLWLAVVALGILFFAIVVIPQQRELAAFPLAVAIAMRWTPIVFAVLAMWASVAQWATDLVERRRHLRVFVLAGGSAYTLLTAFARLASDDGRLSSGMARLDTAVLLTIIGTLAVRLLRVADAGLLRVAPTAPAPVGAETLPDPGEDRLAAGLARLMNEQHAYRGEGLTIARLATQLGAPEYRLRRVINGRLGHRNFNAYINGLRLDEARAALADPARRELPVLTIALDAGFQSIGPFNRAFKAATGLTPTEFRRQKLADS